MDPGTVVLSWITGAALIPSIASIFRRVSSGSPSIRLRTTWSWALPASFFTVRRKAASVLVLEMSTDAKSATPRATDITLKKTRKGWRRR